MIAAAGVQLVIESHFWPSKDSRFPLDSWEKNRAILARDLPVQAWDAVKDAAMGVDFFRAEQLVALENNGREKMDMNEMFIASLGRLNKTLINGAHALTPYIDGKP